MKRMSTRLFIATALVTLPVGAASNDFTIIKGRVIAELMKSSIDDREVRAIVDRMNSDGSFRDINYVDLSRTAGFPQRNHTYRLVYLAQAHKSATSSFYRDASLKEIIERGYNYWVHNDFFGDNWHNNQISTPTYLVNLMLLMGDDLPKELVARCQPMINRAHMGASGARPSGDRIVIASPELNPGLVEE